MDVIRRLSVGFGAKVANSLLDSTKRRFRRIGLDSPHKCTIKAPVALAISSAHGECTAGGITIWSQSQ